MPEKPNNASYTPKSAEMEVINGDYQRLDDHNHTHHHHHPLIDEESPPLLSNYEINCNNNDINRRWFGFRSTWFVIVLGSILAILGFVIIKRFAPAFVNKEVIPRVRWLIQTCSPPVLALVLFAAIALFPILLLPTVPVKWIVGMTFGYGLGFLLVTAAVAVAVSLTYVIASHLFLHKIEDWLSKHPEKAAIIRLAGDGDWLHQFQAIALLRLSPFPYVLLNYVAIATGVKYSPYLAGTVVGMAPEVLFAIYSGKLLLTVVEAMDEHTHVSKFQIVFDTMGFCLSAISTIAIGFYAKWRLNQLQEVEEQQPLL